MSNREMVITKEEIAPGIVIYSDVIPDSENLYKDIEEGMASVNIQWYCFDFTKQYHQIFGT